jgi:DNA-binding HxlR family transcriptional regulator
MPTSYQPASMPDAINPSEGAHAEGERAQAARSERLATESDGLAEALAALGDRWSLAVVASLLDGPQRFGALQERLPTISPNVLSQRLRALEGRGVLIAAPYSQRPTRYVYELTSTGRELAGALRLLGDWGLRRLGASAEPPRHGACGTPLEVRWYCPSCQRPVTAPSSEEDEELYYA